MLTFLLYKIYYLKICSKSISINYFKVVQEKDLRLVYLVLNLTFFIQQLDFLHLMALVEMYIVLMGSILYMVGCLL
jgi:hypothetical protein